MMLDQFIQLFDETSVFKSPYYTVHVHLFFLYRTLCSEKVDDIIGFYSLKIVSVLGFI